MPTSSDDVGEPAATGGDRDDPADAQRMRAYAAALADGVDAALGPWVVRSGRRVLEERLGGVTDEQAAALDAAARRCVDEVAPAVRSLLLTDVDDQRANPLAVVRRAVAYPTEVLRAAGVAPVARDEHAVRLFPDDAYDLSPATFADLDPALHDLGLQWGAAKAHIHLRRRRAEGRR